MERIILLYLFLIGLCFREHIWAIMYTNVRPNRAIFRNCIYLISAAIEAAAAEGSGASTIDRATITKLAPASIAVRALPP